jgi:hypothetical protein
MQPTPSMQPPLPALHPTDADALAEIEQTLQVVGALAPDDALINHIVDRPVLGSQNLQSKISVFVNDGRVVALQLRQLGLTQIPDTIWQLEELRSLNLAENRIEFVADDIGRLSHLTMLDLGHNQISMLPDTLGALRSMRDYLYLHHNRLIMLPGSIGRLFARSCQSPRYR